MYAKKKNIYIYMHGKKIEIINTCAYRTLHSRNEVQYEKANGEGGGAALGRRSRPLV